MRIEDYRNSNETILWKGKPNKSVFIKERIFSPLFIFAALWLVADIGFISIFLVTSRDSMPIFIIIPFFALHLMPVWIYIWRVFSSFAQWKNTEYMVTDKGIYATHGVFTTNCERKTFQEVTNVSVHQGIIDKRHDVGDVFILTGLTTDRNGKVVKNGINIVDIENYMEVYKLVNRVGTDIFSDTMYPNDLRPKDNHGYKTQYKGEDK